MKLLTLAALAISLLTIGAPIHAQGLSLTVIAGDKTVELSMADLDGMPQESFETTTIWTEGTVSYGGVPLAEILDAVEVAGTTLRMVALNDYAVEMPIDEIGETYPVVATRMNGETMGVRDKGPYWVVFPYDSDPKYQTETTYSRSIWQLKTLSVVE